MSADSLLFTLNFTADNFFGVPAGIAQAVAEGYSVIIAPPPPGEYEIVVSAVYEEGGDPFAGTIRIIVEAPQVVEPQATPRANPVAATPVS